MLDTPNFVTLGLRGVVAYLTAHLYLFRCNYSIEFALWSRIFRILQNPFRTSQIPNNPPFTLHFPTTFHSGDMQFANSLVLFAWLGHHILWFGGLA